MTARLDLRRFVVEANLPDPLGAISFAWAAWYDALHSITVEGEALVGEQFEAALMRLFGPRHVTRPAADVALWEIHRRWGWLFSWGGPDYHAGKQRLLEVLLCNASVLLFAPAEMLPDEYRARWEQQGGELWRLPQNVAASELQPLLEPGGWLLYGADDTDLDGQARERFWDAIEGRRYDELVPLFDRLGLKFYLDAFARNDPWTITIRSSDDAELANLVPSPFSP